MREGFYRAGRESFLCPYDRVGNMIDDGQDHEYVYDAWGRLRKILDRSDESLVAEYWYNGLGFLITAHTDTDTDGDVDVNDTKVHSVYDPDWRLVAEFEDDRDDPAAQYVYHNAGLDGAGASSYIDDLALRQDDTTGNGVLDRRIYSCQNWRADVAALVSAGGKMKEWVKYTSYGVAMALPAGDTDSDFDCDGDDINNIDNWPGGYDVRFDLDLDGDVDSTDSSIASTTYQGVTLGWNTLTNPDIGNDGGYAGYRWKSNINLYEVRHRFLDPHLGRWTRRDPLGYVDGMTLYEYVGSRALKWVDPTGRAFQRGGVGSENELCDPSAPPGDPDACGNGGGGNKNLIIEPILRASCCMAACKAAQTKKNAPNAMQLGTGACFFGEKLACACPSGFDDWLKDRFRDLWPFPLEKEKFLNCIREHERALSEDWCCSDPSARIRCEQPRWCRPKHCAECDALLEGLNCIRAIHCDDNDQACKVVKQWLESDWENFRRSECSKCDENDPNFEPSECCPGVQ